MILALAIMVMLVICWLCVSIYTIYELEREYPEEEDCLDCREGGL